MQFSWVGTSTSAYHAGYVGGSIFAGLAEAVLWLWMAAFFRTVRQMSFSGRGQMRYGYYPSPGYYPYPGYGQTYPPYAQVYGQQPQQSPYGQPSAYGTPPPYGENQSPQ